jgi:hypothetical protein
MERFLAKLEPKTKDFFAPVRGLFPYLDTLVITRFLKIAQKPHNYESYTVNSWDILFLPFP